MELLQPAINMGLNEFDFWEMTAAEVQRYLNGAEWRYKTQAQFDYMLADLIGISVGRMISGDVRLPAIEDVYPNLFTKPSEEEVAAKKEEVAMTNSTNRFMEFAMKHNASVKQKGEHDDNGRVKNQGLSGDTET